MNTNTNKPQAAFIIIGNEILSGQVRDKNLPFVASELGKIGISLTESRMIPDKEEAIIKTVSDLRKSHDYVFTSGGIGPTHDDITMEAVAKAFDTKLEMNGEARRRLEEYYAGKPLVLNEARLRMARIPLGATLIDNPISAAPGAHIANVYVMAGVPNIMQAMLLGILPSLEGGNVIEKIVIKTTLPEGNVAKSLGELAQMYPELEIGSYPSWESSGYSLTLVLRGPNFSELKQAAVTLEDMLYPKPDVL